MRSFVHITALATALLFTSCSGHVPAIERVFWQLDLQFFPSNGKIAERLSVYAFAGDRDGRGDLAEWVLYMPSEGLEWRLGPEQWREVDEEETLRIGWNGLAMPFDQALPRGEYVLRIYDRAGEYAEESFIISDRLGKSGDDMEPEDFPRLSFDGGLHIRSPYRSHSIAVSDENGKTLEVLEVEKTGPDSSRFAEWRERGGRFLSVGAYDENDGMGMKSGPYRIPRR